MCRIINLAFLIIAILTFFIILTTLTIPRFASITINLGPTFLSGALAANLDDHVHEPSCPIVQVARPLIMLITMIVVMMQPSIFTIMMMISQGPYRHYVLNLLWILINVLCLALTIYHLNKLYRCNKH